MAEPLPAERDTTATASGVVPTSNLGAETVPPPPVMVACPHCGEQIRADAVTCRHCKRDLAHPNAPRMVLDTEAWNTQVPEWMRELERKTVAQRMLKRKLRRNSWKIVAGLLVIPALVIVWRAFTMPDETYQPGKWASTVNTKGKPVVPVALESPPPLPTPTPEVQSTPTPEPANVLVSKASSQSPLPAPTATPAPTLEDTITNPEVQSKMLGPGTQELPAYDLPVEILAQEFQLARAAAEDQYLGQTLRLTGTVHTIDRTGNTPTFLMGNSKPYIKCLVPPQSREALSRLRPGSVATVRGKCEGAFIEILITEIVIE